MKIAWTRTISMLAAVLALVIGLGSGTVASATEPSPNELIHTAVASLALPDDSQADTIQAAIASAATGDDSQLDALLKSPLAGQTRAALAAWLQARGDLNFDATDLVKPDIKALSTGQYDYYCTSYAGVTLGWNGKVERACHGWMNVYISGNHVARYCPDLFPSPVGAISFACFVTAGFWAADMIIAGATAGWGIVGFTLLEGAITIPLAC